MLRTGNDSIATPALQCTQKATERMDDQKYLEKTSQETKLDSRRLLEKAAQGRTGWKQLTFLFSLAFN